MSSKHRLTRSFRTLSALLYLCNIGCSIHFMTRRPIMYLHILISLWVGGLSILMFMVAIEAPRSTMDRLERSVVGIQFFTFKGRYMADLIIALFLFAMSIWGILLGTATLALIFGIRFLGVKQPDAFNEIFRQLGDIESHQINGTVGTIANDNYTLESEYDTPVVERR